MNELTPQPDNLPVKPKHAGGRPIFDGKNEDEVLTKLKYVWAVGGTDKEAANFAEISYVTLWRYLKQNKEVLKVKNRLKEQPILKARTTVVKEIDHNPEMAFEYLKLKRPEEFYQRGALTTDGMSGSVHLNILNLINNKNEKESDTDQK
jgi:hypothetical protein